MRSKFLIFFGIVLVAGSVWAAAKPTGGALTGKIYNPILNKPVAEALVYAVNTGTGQAFVSEMSNAEGTFLLTGLDEGKYSLNILAGGQTYVFGSSLAVRRESTARLDMVLREKIDILPRLAAPALDNTIGDFTANCFRPPNPPPPPVSGHCGGWWQWLWDHYKGWCWSWHW